MNGTNREIIDADNLQTMGFTPEDTCPNRYSSSTSCPMSPWNPHGSSILLKGWSFPIFIIYDKETIKEMFNVSISNLYFNCLLILIYNID